MMITWLGEGTADPSRLGGKGANLDRLARAGFPVPRGFGLTTDAFRRCLDAHNLSGRVRTLAAALPDRSAREELSALARTLPLPPDLASVLDGAVGMLVAAPEFRGRVAVRSSAVGEDTAGASFAGQHESVLGVRREAVPDAIGTCWASLWSERSVAYRLRRGLGFADAAMAVVIQGLVPAEASAVAFTKDPVGGRADRILINATWGLGEALVSGAVTPDMIMLDKATLQALAVVVGDKRVRVVARDEGGIMTVAAAEAGLSLSAEAITALGELARGVEWALGEPVDIEATFSAGRWHLVQARPITTR